MKRYYFSFECAGVQDSRQEYWTSYRSIVAATAAAKKHRQRHGGINYRMRDERGESWPILRGKQNATA